MGFREGTTSGTLEDAQRFLRYLRMAVLGMMVVSALGVELLMRRPVAPPPSPVLYVFYLLAAADAVVAVILRRRLAGRAAEALRNNPEDASALAKWVKGQIVPLPMALSVAFLGVMARVLGATTLSAAPCYLLALVVIFTSGQQDFVQ